MTTNLECVICGQEGYEGGKFNICSLCNDGGRGHPVNWCGVCGTQAASGYPCPKAGCGSPVAYFYGSRHTCLDCAEPTGNYYFCLRCDSACPHCHPTHAPVSHPPPADFIPEAPERVRGYQKRYLKNVVPKSPTSPRAKPKKVYPRCADVNCNVEISPVLDAYYGPRDQIFLASFCTPCRSGRKGVGL